MAELQKRLIHRKDTLPQSWLIDWWNDAAYFAYRDPVVVNVSYFYAFRDDKLRVQPGMSKLSNDCIT